MKLIKRMIHILFVFSLFSCNSEKVIDKEKTWWKETVFYEIYMPSYKDSNNDGIGDFKGITEKLNYIQSLGIKGIWLTPFFESPKIDNGYDVSDYYKIDPSYGDLNDFKNFIDQAHNLGVKVIIDMVLNHTSTEHHWFKESSKSKTNPYRDYYIWKDKPNNWESFFGGTAWELDNTTSQYYYHKFDVKMADLNWQNPKVVEEIQKVLRFWLELGIDGFRLDVINFLTTDGITNNNPIDENGNQKHLNDINQKGIKNAMKIIKKTINEYDNRFIVGEIGSDKIEVLKQYQGTELLDVVFNFNFGSIPEFSAQRIFDELQSMENNMSNYPTLFFGSHDMPRLVSRLAKDNPERAKALAALMITAKGVPFIYYGEEIGMENINASSIDEINDIQGRIQYDLAIKKGLSTTEAIEVGNLNNRDKSRSPMQWDATKNSGFSETTPWIKVAENFEIINVKNLSKSKESILNHYKKMIAIRNNEPVLKYGKYLKLTIDNDLISLTRVYNKDTMNLYFNFSSKMIKIKVDNPKFLIGTTNLKPDEYLITKN